MVVKAPSNWHPVDARTRPVTVAPTQARCRKRDLYRSVKQFEQVDSHAVQVAETDHANFSDLVWHLAYDPVIRSDLDKARVIFRWMTSKNMYTISFKDGAKPGSPEEVLLSFKSKQGTYARIFQTLCHFAGLSAFVLTGYVKGVNYVPGDTFKGKDYNHCWNAVLIDRHWYLVDTYWATGYRFSKNPKKSEKPTCEYDDFYFLTDPEQLIYSHWACHTQWQLLAQPFSLNDFETMTMVNSCFFKCAMYLVSTHDGVVYTKKGSIALIVGYAKPVNLAYKLTFADSGKEVYQRQSLQNFVLQLNGQNQKTTFVFRAPCRGQYCLTIFAQLLTGELGLENTFVAAFQYKIVADVTMADTKPLPPCSDYSWGPGLGCDQLGLVASVSDGIVATEDGKVNLEFKKTKPAFVLCKLRRNGMRDDELDKCISVKDTGDSVQTLLSLPSKGEYSIEVYGNDPAKDGDTYTHICQYYVHYAPQTEQQKAFYHETSVRHTVMKSSGESIERQDSFKQEETPPVPAFSAKMEVIKVTTRKVGQAPPQVSSSFKLVSLSEDKSKDPPTMPVSRSQQKLVLEAIEKNKEALQSMKDHALEVAKSKHKNFDALMWDLIYSKKISDDMQKVRLIFCWLVTKHQKEIEFDMVEKDSPEEVLTSKQSFAKMFHTMCSYAGVRSQIIRGYAKGVGHKPGMMVSRKEDQHSWNAVHVHNTWCLLDVHWAARRVVGTQQEVSYTINDFFFLPDPEHLIYTHLPGDPGWQLLERPVSTEEFSTMPQMKSAFFDCRLQLVTHHAAIIYSHGGETAIRLRYPHPRMAVAFSFTVLFEDGTAKHNNVALDRYGLHENVNGIASFFLRLPVSGSYTLNIYAKEDRPENREASYSQVCQYSVEHKAHTEPEPYPPCTNARWGLGSRFYGYGLWTQQQICRMFTQSGKVELKFEQSHPMQYKAKLKHNTISDLELETYVIHRMVGNTAYFNITAPGRGEYGLEIYANDSFGDGVKLNHVGQFIIICEEDVKVTPMPKLPSGYLGAKTKFSEFGMEVVSHQDPIISLDCNTVTVTLKCPKPMKVKATLSSAKSDEKYPNFVFWSIINSEAMFKVSLPATGFFKLQIYGVLLSCPSEQLPCLYNYLIECRQVTQPIFPFPTLYSQWGEGCVLYEPQFIPSPTGPFGAEVKMEDLPEKVEFRAAIPGAEAVAVKVIEEWTDLKRGEGDEWMGLVRVNHCYGTQKKVTLIASLGGKKTSYSSLLEYTL